ncbi:MAG: undecaprenyl/decaprenyl-phosphate alpha-N-acetylglucosaminyl 1-phosphate transferase [Flavobacteriales bacterium]|nr:undecaprenyl/decaprenyl-phosphate alpha-N-acetylglucosaminyl 1-phosphate transferase [Flavobacteriales bacterium]MCB9448856.1 undecaprenyl/decaprenyl-phosphate alpha-N-acetylglucosaminyl 1-phosphate transferase [Flavobacteriales bacterium]
MSDTHLAILLYILFSLGCLVFSMLIIGLFLKFSRNLGIRNTSETVIRWGSQSKPAFGGIAFFIIFLLSIACFNIFFGQDSMMHNKEFLGLLGATTLAFLMGLADDAYNTRPLLKLGVQIACGFLLSWTGISIRLFDLHILNTLLTVLWVVGIMNSINMLDNMDAITTIVSFSILTTTLLLLLILKREDHFYTMILLGTLSALTGFLYYNWHPSRMYMGDTGSQFLGLLLAAVGILFFWNYKAESSPVSMRLVLTALVFLLPLTDTFTVIVNRLARKQSPFIGGRDHTTHHLVYLGFSDRQVAVVFWTISIVSLTLVLLVVSGQLAWTMTTCLLLSGYMAVVFLTLFLIVRRSADGKKKETGTNIEN